MVPCPPPAHPPQLLQLYRERLTPGSEAEYHTIEEDTARLAAALGCPHPYLGVESVTGAKEVWWFNGYTSSAEQRQVADDYAKNTRLMAALQNNSLRKAGLTLRPFELVTNYRQDLSAGAQWILGHGRFLVIAVTNGARRITGTVFEGLDGTCVIVTSAYTRQEADAAKALAGDAADIFAVRPSWSFPAKEWSAADPLFWQPRSTAAGESRVDP